MVPVTVRVSRGRPLAPVFAITLVVVGAFLVVFGVAVVGKTEVPGEGTGTFSWQLGAVILVPIWAAYFWIVIRNRQRRRAAFGSVDVPESLAEPPSGEDPAVVATLVGKGTVPPVAAAATALAIARAGWIDLHEVGDQVVVSFDDTPSADWTASNTDRYVIDAMAARRDAATGDVTGPPLYSSGRDWWRAYVADARGRAMAAGLVAPRVPLVGLLILSVVTATVISLVIFWYTFAFVGLLLLANGLPHLIVRVGGYRVTPAGGVERAKWLAFGRGLRERGGLADVGPGGVSVWGPYLVYGVLVGAAPRAAEALTPRDVGRPDDLPSDVVVVTF